MLPASLLMLLLALPAGSDPGRVEAHTNWSVDYSGFRRIAPGDELVVLAQSDGVYGNDAATGVSRWARRDLGEGFGVPTVDAARVYVGAAKGADSAVTTEQATHALDRTTGETRWRSPFWAYEGVAAASERVVGIGAMSSGGKLAVVALRSNDGEVAWSSTLDGLWKTAPRPQAAGELVLCRTQQGIVALRVADGAVAWRSAANESWADFGVHGEVTVVLGADDRRGRARGLRTADGATLWTAQLSAPSTGLAFVADDALVSTWDGEVVRLDLAKGGERWRTKLAAGSSADPLVVSEILLVRRDERAAGSKSARVWSALELANGTVRGDALEVEDKDTLVADARGRLWWSRPNLGKLCSLELRRVP
ncbi:MAG: PQQ-binding-like beta-propeller repeat protein [Planctomycetes bacterium]|nr:PQQ-binding-like beta-propeller repeat protein [Planctomycetota bacterium]